MKLSIVIPVYNEGKVIGETIDRVEAAVKSQHELLIIYDFDGDSTIEPAKKKQKRYKNVKLIKNTRGRGALNAIRTGIEKSEGRAVCVMMADLTDDPRIVDDMISKFDEGFDLVAASRYMKGGSQVGGPILKKALSRIAGVSLNLMTGVPVHDVTNSFRLYSKKLLDEVQIESDGGFEVALELTVKAYDAGYRLTEVPTTWMYLDKESRFNFRKWLPKYLKWYFWLLARKNVFNLR